MAPEGVLPPFAEPTGPLVSDVEVLGAYVRGERAGFSERFHVEPPVLYALRMVPVAIQAGPGTFLVRVDVPDDALEARGAVEEIFGGLGLTRFDEDTLFAPPVAIQVLGVRLSSWDLWGRDIDSAFAELRAAALGNETGPVLGGDAPPGVDF